MDSVAQYAGVDPDLYRGHPVDLEVFSGPLDLLLHLVQKDRIEIWEISICRITEQYLNYLRSLETLNVEVAGEFLLMAVTLMRIKSQMLLPRAVLEEDGSELLPQSREELIASLMEYRRYRDAAVTLRQLEELRQKRLPRGWTPSLPKEHLYPLREARAVDLTSYLHEVLSRPRAEPYHEVQMEEIRLEERISYILDRVTSGDDPVRFADLIEKPWWRLEWIVTFLAVLELVRLGGVIALQEEPFGEIWVWRGAAQGEVQRIDEADHGPLLLDGVDEMGGEELPAGTEKDRRPGQEDAPS